MAPSRGKTPAQTRAQDRILSIASGAGRTRGRSKRTIEDDPPDVYQEMLSEVSATSPHSAEEDRPLKRRKVGGARGQPSRPDLAFRKGDDSNSNAHNSGPNIDSDEYRRPAQLQTVTDSEDSDESEMDWEQIGFDSSTSLIKNDDKGGDDIQDMAIEVGEKTTPKRAAAARRKPATTAEKLVRLVAHKGHLLYLLFHAHIRNSWCNAGPAEVRSGEKD